MLERNGLVGGTLYVFKSKDPAKNSEAPFQSGAIQGEWVAIAGADEMSQAQLEAASDAVGAMTFARPEDGTFNPRNPDEYFFVTTGGAAGANVLGRVYSLRLNEGHTAGDASLKVLVNADAVIAAGGDAPISPDNVDASQRYLMVQEDGTADSRLVMASKGRDGRIWRFDLTGGSGIIDTTRLFGHGTWVFNVQAHSPTAAPVPNTVEDGQLLLLVPDRRDHDEHDDDDEGRD